MNPPRNSNTSLSPTPASDDRTRTPPANPQPRIDPNIMRLSLLRHFKEGPGQCHHSPRIRCGPSRLHQPHHRHPEHVRAYARSWDRQESALPLFSPASNPMAIACSPVNVPHTIVKGPIFWSLERQDFLLCASISETQTRLDLDDMPLWPNAGLAADENSALLPFSPSGTADLRASTDIQEDTRSNELIWLLGKIVNYLTSGDAINPADFALPPGESLPPTFQASARTKRHNTMPANDDFASLEEIWYELPICAATMLSYHMASILLLVNKPQESTAIRTALSARFRFYRRVQHQELWHAREICGISLATPPDPVRIHSVLPLYVAGQVFHEPQEQRAILGLLSAIEMDLGWATSYH
ncbi:hypothetical protein EDB80DRAFT_675613 [Ilyonectria destructans]|nr:hypothetical protein EDB80DRAFT_675613 [Ilyonectria destructans]